MTSQLVLEGVEPPPSGPDFATLRGERGWTEEDVADRLKISVAKVRAIEKLDFAALPDGPYTRGFIRNYARLLDTDPSPWLNLLDAAAQPAAGALRDDPRRLPAFDDTGRSLAMSARLMWWGVVALGLAIALFLGWWERAAWLPQVQGLFPAQTQQSIQSEPVVTATTSPAVTAAMPPAVMVAGAEPAPNTTPAAPAAAADAARLEIPAGHKTVSLAFKTDSWVEVKDASGNLLVSQLNKAGAQQSFTGQPPLRFTVGAAKDVTLQVDGRDFDMSPHIKNDVARFVVN
jgi:cytoskeleton protein RodZ